MSDDFTNLLSAHAGSDNDRKIAMNAVREGMPVPEPSNYTAHDGSGKFRPSVPSKVVNPSDAALHATPPEYEGRSSSQKEDQFGDSVLDMDDLDLDADHVDMEPIVTGEPDSGATYLDETSEPPPPSTGTVMDWMRGTSDSSRSGASSLYGDDDDDDYSRPSRKPKISVPSIPTPSQVFTKHPTWKRPAMFGGAAAVVGIAVAFIFGGSPESETPRVDAPPIAAEEENPVSSEAEITEIRPKAVSALCPPGATSATLAFSKRPEDAWVCGRANGIDGAIMNIIFPSPVTIKSITVVPGWAYVAPNGKDHWNDQRLVTQILWRIGGKQFVQAIVPTRAGGTLTIPGNGITTSEMSLTIQKTERPSAVEGGSLEDVDGDVLPPMGGGGPMSADDAKVDESTAISSITIMGVER